MIGSAMLVVTACGSGAPSDGASRDASSILTSGDRTTSAPAPVTTPVAGVPEALRFTAPTVGGGRLDAASFAGKPTVFWFWAPT